MIRKTVLGFVAAGLVGSSGFAVAQESRIRTFGWVDFVAADSGDDRTTFSLPEVAVLLTSRLTPRWSFLGEMDLVWDDDFEGGRLHLERAALSYDLHPRVRLTAGLQFSPLGHWKMVYQEIPFLHPTAGVPLPLREFEEGGVILTSDLGIGASGRGIGRAGFGYDVLLANGIGAGNRADNNRAKSLAARAFVEPHPSLIAGAALFVDRLTAGTPNVEDVALTEDVSARTLSVFAGLRGSRLEVLGEYYYLRHQPEAGAVAETHAGFAYVGYRAGQVVPYLLLDFLEHDPAEPFFDPDDERGAGVGTRYVVGTTVVAKLELRRYQRDDQDATTSATVQLAFGF